MNKLHNLEYVIDKLKETNDNWNTHNGNEKKIKFTDNEGNKFEIEEISGVIQNCGCVNDVYIILNKIGD